MTAPARCQRTGTDAHLVLHPLQSFRAAAIHESLGPVGRAPAVSVRRSPFGRGTFCRETSLLRARRVHGAGMLRDMKPQAFHGDTREDGQGGDALKKNRMRDMKSSSKSASSRQALLAITPPPFSVSGLVPAGRFILSRRVEKRNKEEVIYLC